MVGYGYDLGTCKHVCKTIDCKTWIFCNLENLDFFAAHNCFCEFVEPKLPLELLKPQKEI